MEFTLVTKYRNKLLSYAYRYNIPPADIIQEARIIEWRLDKYSPLNRINYFLTSCKYTAIKMAYCCNESFDELNEINPSIIDSLISKENFELWYELYMYEISDMLNKIDEILGEIFLMKLVAKVSWSSIRKERFPKLPHNEYWEKVKRVKDTVRSYVKEEKDLPFLEFINV